MSQYKQHYSKESKQTFDKSRFSNTFFILRDLKIFNKISSLCCYMFKLHYTIKKYIILIKPT